MHNNTQLCPGEMLRIKIHSNTPTCPLIYEIVPVMGCEFQCTYCNALGQEDTEKFLPVKVDTQYPEFLRNEIKKHKAVNKNPLYYYCPKSDCFQKPLMETGVTRGILEVLRDEQCHYILVTKGVPTDDLFKLLVETREKCQVIITYGMPAEEIRQAVEPCAAALEERITFAKACVAAGIQTAAILEPLFPFKDLSFVGGIMDRFIEAGVDHFAIDFARVTHGCLERIAKQIPEHIDEFKEIYIRDNSHNEDYRTANDTHVIRYSPPKEYMLEKFNSIKQMAEQRGSTVSICNSFGFDGFNNEAQKRGYICMGINMDMVEKR
ncbi:hypothetical protein [Ruminiclostridium cellobioparum]|uniref:DNA repair photolyase n=1 Tax=Ruminiclostridium cellobioparum subsp. termitidis CT1112 TaxID=1195236 RepID=S0FLA9_RUMCE|nr:hypothetical protein [Ruminiclostridium cellobioparum]EMS72682.1 DNA repair photolyase [Ruminiclostridium cellobioparum subsp. termitidis CT1112]